MATSSQGRISPRTAALALGALVAFSANSILARFALGNDLLDAASYGSIRIASGALMLVVLMSFRHGRVRGGSWLSAGFLALYAAPFAFAYLELTAAAGALLLFGAVQVTMIGAGLKGGERPRPLQWLGIALAVAGLVWFMLPGVGRVPPGGAVLMLIAGVAWGCYSLRGRRAGDPLAETTGNFVRAVPLMLAVSAVTFSSASVTPAGVGYAVASGALASGLGYVVWYAALAGLSATQAAPIQLAVPIVTAWAGVIFLNEPLTTRTVLAGAAVLVGVVLAAFTSRSEE